MKRKFWQFVHDKLETSWHWVYYHKLARPVPLAVPTNYTYTLTYLCDKTGMMTDPSPISGTKTEQLSSD